MTEKLYYSDSHLSEFEAEVLSCTESEKGGFEVVLDRTAFFPEGGGQRADTGYIGSVRVSDVREEKGELIHFTDAPVTPGERLGCRIDYEQRLRRMQNHSGEHIVSGITHALHGFDNVGFHMGSDFITIDFSGELSWDELMEIEYLANEKVRENVEIRTWFPSAEELEGLEYRSKLELTENVRIVEIIGCDFCACCAPHVSRTGEVGIIKIIDFMRHRGGVRVSLLCGMDALDYLRLQQKNVTAISNLLSAKREDVATAVEKQLTLTARQKERIAALSLENAKLRAQAEPETEGNICVFDDILDEIALRELVNLLTLKCGGMAAAFSVSASGDYRYIIGSENIDLRQNAKAINQGISGRGGGSPLMIQGSCSGSADEIREFIINYNPSV